MCKRPIVGGSGIFLPGRSLIATFPAIPPIRLHDARLFGLQPAQARGEEVRSRFADALRRGTRDFVLRGDPAPSGRRPEQLQSGGHAALGQLLSPQVEVDLAQRRLTVRCSASACLARANASSGRRMASPR